MRYAVRLVLFLAALLLFSPFIVSSLLIDQRGVIIPGHVFSKSEYIVSHYTSWTRRLEVTVEYNLPNGYGVSFLRAPVSADRFDSLKKGDLSPLRYLRETDLPHFPGAHTLREMRVLPTVRLEDQRTWSGIQEAVESHRPLLTTVLIAGGILLLWRLLRIPFLAWAVAACLVSAIAAAMLAEFPRPTPAPSDDLRTATAIVKSLDRWEWLFRDNHQAGLQADQPIQIAGVQFVPEGRTEAVVAVDLIDEGSVPGLKEHASVRVKYEAAAPRTAYIEGATRTFVGRNLRGVATQLAAIVVVTAILVAVGWLLRIGFRRAVRRRPI